MAKSLRASNKVKARNARRYTTGSDYQIAHQERLNAASKRLLARVNGEENNEEKSTKLNNQDEEKSPKEIMLVDENEKNLQNNIKTKISTRGPKDSVKARKQAKKFQFANRRKNFLKNKGEKKKVSKEEK